MILEPVLVNTSVTALVTNQQGIKGKTILIANPASGADAFLKFDGSADALTAANGIPLVAGGIAEIGMDLGNYQNPIFAICASGSATLRIHVIQ